MMDGHPAVLCFRIRSLYHKEKGKKSSSKNNCAMKIAGIPYLKYQCLVLWRKRRIPMVQPSAPPARAVKNREASEMRQAPRTALFLSIPMTA